MPQRPRRGPRGTTPRPTSWSPSDDPIASPCSFDACARPGSPCRAPRRVARRPFSCPRPRSRPIPDLRSRSRRDLPTRASERRAKAPRLSRHDARCYPRSTRGTIDPSGSPSVSRRARSVSRRRPSHREISLLPGSTWNTPRTWHASTRRSYRISARTVEARPSRTPPRRGPRAPLWTASSIGRDWRPTPGTTVAACSSPSLCVPNPLSIYLRRRFRSHRAIERFSLIVTTASDYEHASPPRAFPTASLAKARRGRSTRKIPGGDGVKIVADPVPARHVIGQDFEGLFS